MIKIIKELSSEVMDFRKDIINAVDYKKYKSILFLPKRFEDNVF